MLFKAGSQNVLDFYKCLFITYFCTCHIHFQIHTQVQEYSSSTRDKADELGKVLIMIDASS